MDKNKIILGIEKGADGTLTGSCRVNDGISITSNLNTIEEVQLEMRKILLHFEDIYPDTYEFEVKEMDENGDLH